MTMCIRLTKGMLSMLLILSLTTGCWDRQEIEERGVVLGIGIDQVKSGGAKKKHAVSTHEGPVPSPKTEMIRVTVQVAVPGRIPLGPGTGTGAGGGTGGNKTVLVVEAVGRTVGDAIDTLQQRVAPPFFFGHLRIIVVSQEVAKKGLRNLNDFFRRNPDVRRMNWMLISKGQASDMMKASPQLERVPTLYLMTMMEQSVRMGKFPNDFLGIFWSSSSAKGSEGYLPYIEQKSGSTIQITGLAYFRGDKMVGNTNSLEVPLYMGIAGMNPAGGRVYAQIPGTPEYVEFRARNRKSTTKLHIENGRPHVFVKIYVEGDLREKSIDQVKLNHAVIQEIEKGLEKDVKKAYLTLIHKTQEKHSDIFGFGEYVRAKQPTYWKSNIRSKEKWQQVYTDIPVDIEVHINMRRVGMKAT